jgi:hypothetical protein
VSIATELENFKTFLSDSYVACSDKKAIMPENKNLKNLANCIKTIQEEVGTEVTVEAQTTIDAGDKIVGIKNANAISTLSSSSPSVPINILSADGSVAISGGEITANSNIMIHFLTPTGVYGDTFQLTIESLPSDISNFDNVSSMAINNDGTLAMISKGRYVLVVDISKRSKSASYSIESVSVSDIPTTVVENVARVHTPTIRRDRGVILDNYIICSASADVTVAETGAAVITHSVLCVFKYNNSSLKLLSNRTINGNKVYTSALPPRDTNVFLLNGDTIATTVRDSYSRVYLCTYTISTGLINLSSSLGEYQSAYFSTNGRYIGLSSSTETKLTVKKLNKTDLSLSTVRTFGIGGACFPSDDGSLTLLSTGGVYDTANATKLHGGACTPANLLFEPTRWVAGGDGATIYAITPSTEAEYLISQIVDMTLQENRVYGIANDSMTVGMQGTAQIIFDTYDLADFKLQDKTVTPSIEEQVIVADNGYSGLGSVTVEGDSNLIAENIKKGVRIFGVKGTLEPTAEDEETIQYLEYIESTGAQWIDTGYKVTSNTNIILDYEFISGNSNSFIPLAVQRVTNGSDMFGIWVNSSTYKVAVIYGTVDSGSISGTNGKGRHVYSNTGNKFYIDNTLIKTIQTNSFASTGTLPIFALRTSLTAVDTRNSSGKLYSLQIFENDTLARDFKPALDENGVVCLYDKISKEYYYNAGTGDFVAGDVIKPIQYVEYIESSGTQYIDTGVLASGSALGWKLKFSWSELPTNGNSSSMMGAFTWGGANGTTIAIPDPSTRKFCYQYGPTASQLEHFFGTTDTNTHVIESNIEAGVMKFDGQTILTNCGYSAIPNTTVYLFASHRQGQTTFWIYGRKRVYSCEMYENGVLVRDFKPALDENGVACLYDEVSKTYFYNKGTGDFVSGGVIS